MLKVLNMFLSIITSPHYVEIGGVTPEAQLQLK